MTNTEFLIVGQGISGTFLSWYLHRAGRSFVVIDKNDPASSSRVAAGIINPVTGRRVVKTWMIEEILPFAVNAYEMMGRELGIEAITEKKMIEFFPSAQMRMAFSERGAGSHQDYISLPGDESIFFESFNYELGFGEISPCYLVNLPGLLLSWRNRLKKENSLIEDTFSEHDLKVHSQILYKNIAADKIIFCDGIYSSTNRFFRNLPFALNKGEALIIHSKDLSPEFIYKKNLTLAPLGNERFWVGASYEWDFTDNLPSDAFRDSAIKTLSTWLKKPFEVEDHVASIRPATVERRPFVGTHPWFPSVGILNGMGTKGCSLSPYFANQFVNHLTKNTPILPDVDISRFSGILKSSLQ
ncbi:MAG: FAD-binding oxidoreductase [Chitinophagaceae bacterium]|nr:FAD-binding oxidoreductase [Chitinophagaceae bacterium]